MDNEDGRASRFTHTSRQYSEFLCKQLLPSRRSQKAATFASATVPRINARCSQPGLLHRILLFEDNAQVCCVKCVSMSAITTCSCVADRKTRTVPGCYR